MRWIDIAFLLVIVAGILLYIFFKSGFNKVQPRLKKKEFSVLKYLEDKGYNASGHKMTSEVKMKTNGRESVFSLTYDFAVNKDGRNYLVIIRTSEDPERLNNPLLRNKLLLLYTVFKPHGLLLINPETEKIQKIEFRFQRSRSFFLVAILIFILLIMLVVLFLIFTGGILCEIWP